MEQKTKDFIEKLNSGNLKPTTKLLGIVKRSDEGSSVLFAFKHDVFNWITIPGSMIESVRVIKNIQGENIPGEKETLVLAKLYIKEPSAPEAKVLYQLLASLSEKVNNHFKKKWMKKMLFGEEDDHYSMGCHCKGMRMHHKCGQSCGKGHGGWWEQ